MPRVIACRWGSDRQKAQGGTGRRIIIMMNATCLVSPDNEHHMKGDPNDPESICLYCGAGYDPASLKQRGCLITI